LSSCVSFASAQAHYLGQPWQPFGFTALDYFIADPVAMPAELHAVGLRGSGTTERLALLPHYYSFHPREHVDLPDDRQKTCHELPQDAFILASFNSNQKLNPALFGTWLQLLRVLPRAVLWLPGVDAKTGLTEKQNTVGHYAMHRS
jgi:predicted O-linked N-acetylglucosamine transferase (SPINDLY family)